MKILFVAMSDSVHTARWIEQISDQGWDLHLFPTYEPGLTHRDLKGLTLHNLFYPNEPANAKNVRHGARIHSKLASRGLAFSMAKSQTLRS